MSKRRMIFGFLVCFSMAVFVGQTLSQTRGRSKRNRLRNTNQEKMQQSLERQKQQLLQQLHKQMGLGKSEKELMKPILRATEKQWKAIEAKVNRVLKLRNLANVSIELMMSGMISGSSSMSGSSVVVNKGSGRGSMSGFGIGSNVAFGEGETTGWRWSRPSRHRDFESLNEGEKICEELFRLLEGKNSELEEIRQKMEALQKFRQEAKKELAIAQKELRQLVAPHQEAALVMMQLLD